MTREEAVRSFTSWNAYASRRKADLGSLAPGKRADLVVLSDDVFTCPEGRIREILPVLTMVGGEVVFTKPFGAPCSQMMRLTADRYTETEGNRAPDR